MHLWRFDAVRAKASPGRVRRSRIPTATASNIGASR